MMNRWPVALIALLLQGGLSSASLSHDSNMTKTSPLAYSNPQQSRAAPTPVTVTLALDDHSLTVHFKVTCAKIFAREQLAHGEYPYEYDVVELFVANANLVDHGYYEFEVSPYNQSLQVNVVKPREEYYFGVKNGFSHEARIVQGGWEADMSIPLAALGWEESQPLQLVGNAYAALGDNDHRVYWSLFELSAGKPDFHAPSAFRPLFDAK